MSCPTTVKLRCVAYHTDPAVVVWTGNTGGYDTHGNWQPPGRIGRAYEMGEYCGWTFDSWTVTYRNLTTGESAIVQSRVANYWVDFSNLPTPASDGDVIEAVLDAHMVYAGTGKIMVSYNDHSKVLRTADTPIRIFIDN